MTTEINPICLFDSGIGGITVLKKLINRFPNENYIYLSDLARVPFGDKKKEEINIIVGEITDWLLRFNPKIIIMACNTSSALVLNNYKEKLQIPVYGTISSCSHDIAQSTYSNVTVWATKLAAESHAYKNSIQKINPKITVEEIACPKLVPMIEDLSFNADDKNKIVQEYIEKISKDSEALILGCTHYPLLTNELSKLLKIKIIDPADSLMSKLEKLFYSNRNLPLKGNVTLYTTAQLEKVQRFANLYLCGTYKTNLITLSKINV